MSYTDIAAFCLPEFEHVLTTFLAKNQTSKAMLSATSQDKMFFTKKKLFVNGSWQQEREKWVKSLDFAKERRKNICLTTSFRPTAEKNGFQFTT